MSTFEKKHIIPIQQALLSGQWNGELRFLCPLKGSGNGTDGWLHKVTRIPTFNKRLGDRNPSAELFSRQTFHLLSVLGRTHPSMPTLLYQKTLTPTPKTKRNDLAKARTWDLYYSIRSSCWLYGQ